MFRSLSPGAIGARVSGMEEGMELAARHGFEGYHFGIGEVVKLGVGKVKEMAESKEVRLSAWGFPVNFRQDREACEKDTAELPQLAKAAQELGVLRTATWIMPASDELTYEENFKFHVERLKPAAAVLADYGICLGLEYVSPKTSWSGKKHPFAHTMKQMGELCAAVGENVGFLLDSWHWYCAQESVGDLQKLSAGQVVDVHVNDAPAGIAVEEQVDNVRAMPAETGVIDIAVFLGALKEIGYDGPVMAEPFSEKLRQMEADQAVAATAASLQKIWDQAGI